MKSKIQQKVKFQYVSSNNFKNAINKKLKNPNLAMTLTFTIESDQFTDSYLSENSHKSSN